MRVPHVLITVVMTTVALSLRPVWAQSCPTNPPSQRTDCGFIGVTQPQCVAQGCCWAPVNPNPGNLPWCYTPSSPQCDPNNRQDCGYVGVNQTGCENSGCCWSPVNPNPNNEPWCFYKTSPPSYYTVTQAQQLSFGWKFLLAINGSMVAPYGKPISPLAVVVNYDTADRIRVKIYDPNNARWEIPQSILPDAPTTSPASTNYVFNYVESPFSFSVARPSGEILFDSSASSLVFTDQYIALSSSVAQNPNIYGLGEHRISMRLPSDNHVYTMWSRDAPTPVDQNEYGSHPFYLEVRPSGSYGAFLKSSNGMDVTLSSGLLTFKVIGGVIDLFVFDGPNPNDVIAQYHQVIGTTHIPPYWALGWHQCRYGYPNLQYVEQVVANYSAANIPLDTMWTDIDHMNNYEDFSWDPVNYPQNQVAQFVSQLHGNGQQYVVIVDPGIHTRSGYAPYDQGLQANIFIKQSDGQSNFVGQVWPGATVFPDFFNPNAQTYWSKQIAGFLTGVPLDGLWIDMNEISNFQDGQPTSSNPVNNPPYQINNMGNRTPLNVKTLSMDCLHYGGVFEYNAHNLFGMTEAIATRTALETFYNKRSFVLSRSTFAGAGKHTAHWTGDNFSDFDSMASSVRQIMNHNMFGIAFVGADICGFLGDTTVELCTRWSSLGAFYPFARNHNDIHSAPQEPYRWPQVAAVSRTMLAARYSLLPYYYTLFAQAHFNGGTVVRPVLFEFPADSNTWGLDTQFMVGPGLMVSPVLTQGATTVNIYFPQAQWYSWWTNALQAATGFQSINSPVTDLQVHVRGGVIIPTQVPAMTTAATRKNPFTLLVALDANKQSAGSLYWDDGQSLSVGGQAVVAQYATSSAAGVQTITATIVQANYAPSSGNPVIAQVTVLGVTVKPTVVQVAVNGGSPVPHMQFSYSNSNTLTISQLSLNIAQTFTIDFE